MAEIIPVKHYIFDGIILSFLVFKRIYYLRIRLTRGEGGNLCLGVCAYSAKGKKSDKISDNYNIFLGKKISDSVL